MEIINGKLYKITNTKIVEKPYDEELDLNDNLTFTYYREVKNISNEDKPVYKETDNRLVKIGLNLNKKCSNNKFIYKGEEYPYIDWLHNELFESDCGYENDISVCTKNKDTKTIILDSRALKFLGLFCGARLDIMKASQLNIDGEYLGLKVFIVADDDGNVIDILYSTDRLLVDDRIGFRDILDSEFRSMYDSYKTFMSDVVNDIIYDYTKDSCDEIKVNDINSVKLNHDVELKVTENGSIIITKADIEKVSVNNVAKVMMTIDTDDEDYNVALEFPYVKFPTKEFLYSKEGDDRYFIPLSEITLSLIHGKIFDIMNYNLDHEIFDWDQDESLIGVPSINLEHGAFIDLMPVESEMICRFYSCNETAFMSCWKIHNCDKFDKLWQAYIIKNDIY